MTFSMMMMMTMMHLCRIPWQMDMDMSEIPPVDINGGIDVLSILGITEDGSTFMQPQDPQGNS